MHQEVQVPVLAESISEARLLGWHKQPGDTVQRGENLVDIETDKVTLEVPAPVDGKIHSLLKEPGQLVDSKETIALIESAGPGKQASAAAPPPPAASPPTLPAAAPTLPAAPPPTSPAAAASPPVAPPPTSPAAATSPPVAPPPTSPATAASPPAAPPSTPLAAAPTAPAAPPPTPPVAAAAPPTAPRPAVSPAVAPPVLVETPQPPREGARPAATPAAGPAARNLLEEHGLEAGKVTPSGPRGRLLKEDVLRHLSERMDSTGKPTPVPAGNAQPAPAGSTAKATPVPAAAQATPTPKPAAGAVEHGAERSTKRTPMSGLRRNIAKRLLQAQHESALLSTFNEVNMLPVMQLRKRYQESFEKRHGTKLGLMSFFTRAAVEALQRFPVLNASIDGNDVLHHEYYDIGIAVSAPRGLVVPVLRNADRMSLADIELRIRELAEKARKGKLSVEELLGGTFTITNGGIFGSLLSTPIINPPQSAILGMHKIQERPVAEEGAVVLRPMMYLALSYDHRLIDGRDAVQFLVCIKEQLEDPARMLIQA